MICTEEEDIEHLPTLGGAMSINTIKQGRRESIGTIVSPKYKAGKSEPKQAKKNETLILTARTISTHKYVTQAQKNLALKLMEQTSFSLWEMNWINNVRNQLSRKGK